MKLYRVFLIVLMTSAFAVVGCGDSGGRVRPTRAKLQQ